MGIQFFKEQIADGAIVAAKLGSQAVESEKIKDAAVTLDKLHSNAKTATVGGVSITLGATNANPAFNLSQATNYPASSLTGTITNNQLAGSITKNKIDAPDRKVSIAGNDVELGSNLQGSTLAAALALSDIGAPQSDVALNNKKITGLAAPTQDSDAATKGYVDSAVEGLDVKESVKVATDGNITLSGTQTIDGVSVTANDRVLVKSQLTASQNGIYICKSDGWDRAADMPVGSKAAGAFTFVEEGTKYADQGWVVSSGDTVGTDALVITQFNGAEHISAGAGITKDGNELSISTGGVSNSMLAGSIDADKLLLDSPFTRLGDGKLALVDSTIGNSKLVNDTISGKALGQDLAQLDNGDGIATFDYNGSTAKQVKIQKDGNTLTVGAAGIKVAQNGISLEELGVRFRIDEISNTQSDNSINLSERIKESAFRDKGNILVSFNGQILRQVSGSAADYSEYSVSDNGSVTSLSFGGNLPNGGYLQVRYMH